MALLIAFLVALPCCADKSSGGTSEADDATRGNEASSERLGDAPDGAEERLGEAEDANLEVDAQASLDSGESGPMDADDDLVTDVDSAENDMVSENIDDVQEDITGPDCVSLACLHGGLCVEAENDAFCDCDNTGYQGETCETDIDECLMDICGEHGSCENLPESFICSCEDGFDGPLCDACAPVFFGSDCAPCPGLINGLLCSAHGTCADGLDGSGECVCEDGWSGELCDSDTEDNCIEHACVHGACVDGAGGYDCECETNWVGFLCDEDIADDCLENACAHGTCMDGFASYSCQCEDGWGGELCDQDIEDNCVEPACVHGSCVDAVDSYVCQCDAAWGGELCDEDIEDGCLDDGCVHGSCLDEIGGFSCDCQDTWGGALCDEDIDDNCAGHECVNGSCVDEVSGYSCQCSPGWGEPYCDKDIENGCLGHQCVHGICVDQAGSYVCVCEPDWGGLLCDQDLVDECLDNQCVHGACVDELGFYSCDCEDGWTGTYCEEDSGDDCVGNACQNGSCIDDAASYTCACEAGWGGAYCDQDIEDNCANTACLHGSCVDQSGGYQCECEPGWGGTFCDWDIEDDCVDNACVHGVCIDDVSGYTCKCTYPWGGELCDMDIVDDCLGLECGNGVCIDAIAQAYCECEEGWAGEHCDVDTIDGCAPQPCLQGAPCTDGVGTYFCDCTDTGYEGPSCEIDVDDCLGDNGGCGQVCVNLPGTHECACDDGYALKTNGVTCVDINECMWSAECSHGGICINEPGSYLCDCTDTGYQGANCETDVDECQEEMCQHGGECINESGDFSCECTGTGFKGPLCEIMDGAPFRNTTKAMGLEYDQCATCSPKQGCAVPIVGPCGQNQEFSGGAAGGDYDNDGWIDLFVSRYDDTDILFRNMGDGTFMDVSEEVGLTIKAPTNGAAWGDIDNDGDLDLYVLALGGQRHYLYINHLNPDAPESSGVATFTEEAMDRDVDLANGCLPDWPSSWMPFGDATGFSVALGDYDRDGFLDIHVTEVSAHDTWTEAQSHRTRLLRNLGAENPGYFEDMTDAAGVGFTTFNPLFQQWEGWSFTSSFTDFDQDGWPDLIITGDFITSRLFWNNQDGTFTDGTSLAGINGAANPMGSAIGDVDGDGLLDWLVTSIYIDKKFECFGNAGYGFPNDGNKLYRNEGDRTFTEATFDHVELFSGGWAWAASFGDFDNDTDLDLLVANGLGPLASDCEIPTKYWEMIDGILTPNTEMGLNDTGGDGGTGLVVFDADNDGDLDFFVTHDKTGSTFYENRTTGAYGYLRVRLQGTHSNRQGYGAFLTLQIEEDGPTQVRELIGGSNYISQNEPVIHYGLGTGDTPIHELRIKWPHPDTPEQVLNNVERNQVLDIIEPL